MIPNDAPRPVNRNCIECGVLLPAQSFWRCPPCLEIVARAVRAKLGGTVLPSHIAEERGKG
jgi:hypothetical protein